MIGKIASGRICKILISLFFSSFEMMNELGSGFLESIYKNALIIRLQEKGLIVEAE